FEIKQPVCDESWLWWLRHDWWRYHNVNRSRNNRTRLWRRLDPGMKNHRSDGWNRGNKILGGASKRTNVCAESGKQVSHVVLACQKNDLLALVREFRKQFHCCDRSSIV